MIFWTHIIFAALFAALALYPNGKHYECTWGFRLLWAALALLAIANAFAEGKQ